VAGDGIRTICFCESNYTGYNLLEWQLLVHSRPDHDWPVVLRPPSH
jgi:hypothetical protein